MYREDYKVLHNVNTFGITIFLKSLFQMQTKCWKEMTSSGCNPSSCSEAEQIEMQSIHNEALSVINHIHHLAYIMCMGKNLLNTHTVTQ